MMFDNIKFKLASGSPRRKQLLSMLDVDFDVVTTREVNEDYPSDLNALEVAPFLARLKAEAYHGDVMMGDVWITADTVVVCENQVIGKPSSLCNAKEMLHFLSGKTHHVVTGVCVFDQQRLECFKNITAVKFANLSDDEINEYVDSYKPLDKAGAYGIQELIGAIAVEGIQGSFYNVMGLPIHHLYTVLKKFVSQQ